MINSGKKKFRIALNLLIIAFTIILLNCSSSPIKIKYAERTYKLITDTHELTPVSNDSSIVLDLKINGIGIDEFNTVDKDSIYILAGENRCQPFITRSGIIGGEKTIRFAFIIPVDVLELTLHIGSYPPKTFKVDEKIYSELKDW
ncbi:MAG: hypothetical protein JW965_01575 [Bacteroidales bacterium]|nr:hypothetical protein [Bacteroidales bacterium]